MATGDHGIRDSERLEEDNGEATPRGVTLAFVVLGAACIVFAAVALAGRTSQKQEPKSDPLGELLAKQSAAAGPSASASARTPDLTPNDVTFPRLLSDEERQTTALAAVRGAPIGSSTSVVPTRPPPATDRLPVAPLPAQAVLEASPIVTRPRDPLTKVASEAAQIASPPTSSDAAPEGHDGGYQLQVSSFHTQAEADSFAEQLRARGHRAYVVEARVVGRGTWYRVRIGPFPTQHAAMQYRASFEEREHVVPFMVPPETTAKAH
jgi:cell division septation protein DedD